MVALVVTTKNEMHKVAYDAPHYEVIREAVGGHYELVYPEGLQKPYCMMVNEEGQLLGMPLNPLGTYLYGSLIHGSFIAGDIIILRFGRYAGEPEVVGMSDEEAQRLGDSFVQLSSGVVHWASGKEGEPTPYGYTPLEMSAAGEIITAAFKPFVSPEPAFSNRDLMQTLKLMELVEQGVPASKIAEEMGVSYGQALTWVARLCIICEEYIATTEGRSQL